MRGCGEWQVRRHGPGRRRQWRKVHLATDVATGDLRGVEVTSSQTGDSPVLPDLLAQIPADQAIGTVTADGPCDTRTCHTAIAGRGGAAVRRGSGPPDRIPALLAPHPQERPALDRRTVLPQGPGTRSCEPRGTSVGRSGSG